MQKTDNLTLFFLTIPRYFFFYNPGLLLTPKAPFGVNTRVTAYGFTCVHVYPLKPCNLIYATIFTYLFIVYIVTEFICLLVIADKVSFSLSSM